MSPVYKIFKWSFISLLIFSVLAAIAGAGIVYYFSRDLPKIISIEDYRPLGVTQIFGKDDAVLAEYYEERRYVIPFEDIPKVVQDAFIAAEDDRFFEHHGIDLMGIIRAAIVNFKAGRVVQGGSTITQQVAKSLLLTPEKSFFRKIREIILASRMEKTLSKKQILFLYLNQIYLGQGAYGIQAAAKTYFNKDAKELTLAEAAILAGLPQAPSKYSPLLNPRFAIQRQHYVLRRMLANGSITSQEMMEAFQKPIQLYLYQDSNLKIAAYYVEYLRKHLLEKYGKDVLYRQGLKVFTPITTELAKEAQYQLREGLRALDKNQGYRGPIQKVAAANMKKALAEIEDYNLNLKLPYIFLNKEGVLERDLKTRISNLNLKNFQDFYDSRVFYKGLVTSVEDGKKEVSVNLGIFKGILPLKNMQWAQTVSEPSSTALPPIQKPSQALRVGDVIWVRVLKPLTELDPFNPIVEVTLEQEPVVQGGLVSIDVRTGEVLSMVGGYDFTKSEFNRVIQAERQLGSVYKPIIYAAALEKGYTPATIIQDSPIVFAAGENEKWKPENFEEKFYGDTLFRSALVKSRNIPTIKIVQDIDVSFLIDFSKRLGLGGQFNHDLSIALGSSTATLLDITKVYTLFPRAGHQIKPVFFYRVVDREGNILEENKTEENLLPDSSTFEEISIPPKPVLVAGELQIEKKSSPGEITRSLWVPNSADPKRVMDARVAAVMTHIMNEVTTVGTGAKAKSLGREAAGKTGTTNDALDAWFIGFTPQVVTGVWVGFDQQKSLGSHSTGAQVALPIWLEYMKEAVKKFPDEKFTLPKGVVFAHVDIQNGRLAKPTSPRAVRELFVAGTEPGANSAQVIQNTAQQPQNIPAEEEATDEDFFKQDIQ